MRRLGILVLALGGLTALVAGCVGGEEEEFSSAGPATPTAASPSPTATVSSEEARQPVWTVSRREIDGQIEIMLEDGLGDAYVVYAGPESWGAEVWTIDLVMDLNGFIADLNADGLDDAIVLHFTGGAHCCFEYLVFSETPAGIQLDDLISRGNGSIKTVEDLDGDGVPELEGSDDRLAYFGGLSFGDCPGLPLVLCRTGEGTYADCTPHFPEKLERNADYYERGLSALVQGEWQYEPAKRGAALGLLASYMRLGRADEGWAKVRNLCPECEGWLMQNLAELEQALSAQPPRQTAK
jgi:hypothetical protein